MTESEFTKEISRPEAAFQSLRAKEALWDILRDFPVESLCQARIDLTRDAEYPPSAHEVYEACLAAIAEPGFVPPKHFPIAAHPPCVVPAKLETSAWRHLGGSRGWVLILIITEWLIYELLQTA